MFIHKRIGRRKFLRGMLGGGAVTVALPFLECFLSYSGSALADGTPLPVRFGTWFWMFGMNEKVWIPDRVGADYDLKPELAPIASVKRHVNVFSRYRLDFGGFAPSPHYSGGVLLRCGQAPTGAGDVPRESIDVTIADSIGGG